jgi:hypothetical protein
MCSSRIEKLAARIVLACLVIELAGTRTQAHDSPAAGAPPSEWPPLKPDPSPQRRRHHQHHHQPDNQNKTRVTTLPADLLTRQRRQAEGGPADVHPARPGGLGAAQPSAPSEEAPPPSQEQQQIVPAANPSFEAAFQGESRAVPARRRSFIIIKLLLLLLPSGSEGFAVLRAGRDGRVNKQHTHILAPRPPALVD